MKKMILGVAALAAATSFAAIESANVVGYQQIPVQSGYVLLTPTFKGVNGNLDLSTVQIVNAAGEIIDDIYSMVGIQKMDDTGAYLDVYGYDYESYQGWECAGSPIAKGEVTFSVGESMCVANDYGETVYFRFSGEVDLVNKNEVGQGYVLWGNSTPVAIDLTDVNIVNADGEIIDDIYSMVGIQKMDDTGAYLDVYGYDYDSYQGWECAGTPISKGDFVLQPGEAVCVANDYGETVFLKIPSPMK